MPLGFPIGRFVGPFQTDELGQGWRIAHLQTQRGVRRRVAHRLARVIVVIPLQREAAKNPLHMDCFPALARLSGFGLVAGIDAVNGLLEQPTDQRIGGFENCRAHQHFQLGDTVAVQLPGFKAGDQLLDFFFLGEEDFGRD